MEDHLKKSLTRMLTILTVVLLFQSVIFVNAEDTNTEEEQVYTNVLLKKLPTSNKKITNPSVATNGFTNEGAGEDVTTIHAGVEDGSLPNNGYDTWDDSYLQYDFGTERSVEEIKIYRNYYSVASVLFKNVKVELSTTEDFRKGTVTTVFDLQDVQDNNEKRGAPQVITLEKPIDAQYMRVWGRGHYIKNDNGNWAGMSNALRFAEIEVYANVPASEVPEEPKLEIKNIALGKTPYVYGLDPTNLESISDGKVDDNYSVHNSPGNRWLQFDFKNKYTIHKINFKLEEGVTYKTVRVDVSSSPKSGFAQVYNATNFKQDKNMVEILLDTPILGSHVKFTVNADTKERITKYSEVEIWAAGDNFDESREVGYEGTRENTDYTELVWSDEFNEDAIDETKWNIIEDMVNHGAIYNRDAVGIKKDEKDSYLSIRSKNYDSTANLMKELRIDPETFTDYTNGDRPTPKHVTWSSGRIESKNKYSFQYGRVAVKAKPNDSQGIWPAIWMLSQDEVGHDEIDILEYLGNTPYDAWATNHFGKWGTNKRAHGVPYVSYEAWSEAFHVYEVEWDPEAITFFIDGKEVFKTTQGKELDSMHARPFFTILETQVGDGWVGPVDYNKEVTKQDSEYLVDWVRIYQQPDASKVKFDDLETLEQTKGTDYLISPYATSGNDNFVKLTDGEEEFQDKNNFMYGGQPSYQTNRIAVAQGQSDQYLIYKVNDIEDIHLTTYYRTIADKSEYEPSTGLDRGFSIETSLQDNQNLDFELYTSKDGIAWTKFDGLKQNNNWVDYPKRARVIWDAYNLPEQTNYVKIAFPNHEGKTYQLEDGTIKPVLNTDVQLAKVAFLQKSDQTPPITAIHAPDSWVNHDVTVTLTAEDDRSGPVQTYYTINGGEFIEGNEITLTSEGNHIVEYYSVDHAGNKEETKRTNVKIDKSAPELTLRVSKDTLWPANHKMVPIDIEWDVEDNLSGVKDVLLQSVTSNEPDNGNGDGNTTEDIQDVELNTSDSQISLRAERSDKGEGRIYTITYTASDHAGNIVTEEATVKVPKSAPQNDKSIQKKQ